MVRRRIQQLHERIYPRALSCVAVEARMYSPRDDVPFYYGRSGKDSRGIIVPMAASEGTEQLTHQLDELKRRAHQISVDITHFCGKQSESIGRADEVCAAILRLEWCLGHEDKCIEPPPIVAVQTGC